MRIMRPKSLLLRCYAEHDEGLWVAVCLDFSLGCQGSSFEEVKAKLEDQIREYLVDVLAGEDRAQAATLLRRRAPLSMWLKYWRARLVHHFKGTAGRHEPVRRLPFSESIPLVPTGC